MPRHQKRTSKQVEAFAKARLLTTQNQNKIKNDDGTKLNLFSEILASEMDAEEDNFLPVDILDDLNATTTTHFLLGGQLSLTQTSSDCVLPLTQEGNT
jgi:hypothetical protein